MGTQTNFRLASITVIALIWAWATDGRAVTLVPPPVDLQGIVVNEQRVIALGKALFWDQSAGSDGMACASCHFHAGADSRVVNQLNPGFLDETVNAPSGDVFFGAEITDGSIAVGDMPSGAPAAPNYALTPDDFPLHQLDPAQTVIGKFGEPVTDRNSQIITTSNDRVSSAGAVAASYKGLVTWRRREICSDVSAEIFHAGDFAARQVEPRNTPSVVNAAFNHRNFWDGRANNIFNGVGVFGLREVSVDPTRRILVQSDNGELQLSFLQIENASLASQAVGPPVSALEMSCDGRTFMELGRKLLAHSHRPLKFQTVHPQDSVLGAYRNPTGRGLDLWHNYRALIRRAFHPRYWSASGRFRIAADGTLEVAADGYTQMELNFSMFWGIAIMLYERTLISDQSEFDTRVAAGLQAATGGCSVGGIAVPDLPNADAVERGCEIFFARQSDPGRPGANCGACHGGADGGAGLFSSAAFQAGESFDPVTSGNEILADRGYFNIGVHPVFTDRLSGRLDPWGNPLSFASQYKTYLGSPRGEADLPVDPIVTNAGETLGLSVDACDTGVPVPCDAIPMNVDGASKTPGLRNVALTPPYFHTGGYATLRQVLEFYNRGGDRRAFTDPGDPDVLPEEHPVSSIHELCTAGDTTGSGPLGESGYPLNETVPWNQTLNCGTNAIGLIVPLGLSDAQLDDLEAFLKALTDPLVQCDAAPFDHPSLFITHGHLETDVNSDARADDIIVELPAVGAAGYDAESGLCIPNAGDLFAPGMRARLASSRPIAKRRM